MSDREVVLRWPYPAGSVELMQQYLQTDWKIRTCNPKNPDDDYASAMHNARAMLTMFYRGEEPPAPNLELLQVPGAGYDGVDRSSTRAACSKLAVTAPSAARLSTRGIAIPLTVIRSARSCCLRN